jgi:predicted nucleotidyltransferase
MRAQDLHLDSILFKAKSGSHAYGLNTPTSDVDIRGVFIAPKDVFYGLYLPEQASDDTNDTTYYELRRFVKLLSQQNPNTIEFLNFPDDCILKKHPLFDRILEHKDKFISCRVRDTFSGYAIAQIGKSRGLHKKIVNPMDKEKKTPLDFCYTIYNDHTISLKEWIPIHFQNKTVEEVLSRCGLSALNHVQDGYAMFYDTVTPFNEASFMRGICFDDSNDVHLSSIPKQGVYFVCHVFYNKDAYSRYCRNYSDYWKWVENRNPDRYAKNMEIGKGADFKNIMHCVRLLRMSEEMLRGEGLNVRRPDREEPLEIRNGLHDYDELLAYAEGKIKLLDELVPVSPLPKEVDIELLNKLLIDIRNEYYAEQQP